MSGKLWTTITSIAVLTSTLAACQTPLKSTALNQSIEESAIILVSNIPDSDGDGVPDDMDECPATPKNIVPDAQGCPFTGMGIGLKLEYRAFFAKGSSELSKEYQLELDKVAQKLQEYYKVTMRIEGHASTDELDEKSDAKLRPDSLSRNRALIVKKYLIMQHQINPDRLSINSYGAEQPIAPSDTEEGKSMNRRVYGLAIANFDTEEERSMNRRVYGLAQESEDDIAYQQPNDSKSDICTEFK